MKAKNKTDPYEPMSRAFSDAYGSMTTYALMLGVPPADAAEIIGKFFGECRAAKALFQAHLATLKKQKRRR